MAKRKPSNVYFFPQTIGDPARAKVVRASRQARENDFDRRVVDVLWEEHRQLIAIERDARAGAQAVLYLLRLPRAERVKMAARERVPRSVVKVARP